MGYNTTLMILNDRWHEVMNNPIQFVESIEEEMRKGGGTAAFQTTVMPMADSYSPQLYYSQANWMNHFWLPDLTEERQRPELSKRVEEAIGILYRFDKRLVQIMPT